MYCEDWLEDNLGKIPSKVMTSQSTSRLLQTITDSERIEFFSQWAKLRNESEYLALDITSVSSYSEFIDETEPGKNKENDPLDQVNLCLLFGETSILPVYSTYYAGSIRDVSTLISTVEQLTSIHNKKFKLVLDKGFYSKENINYLLSNHPDLKFIIAVPFTSSKARDLALDIKELIQDKNRICTSSQMLYAQKKRDIFEDTHYLNYYRYYDPRIFTQKDSELYLELNELRIKIQKDINEFNKSSLAKKFIQLNRKKNFDENGEYIVQLKHPLIKRSLINSGKLILVSNDNLTCNQAIEIYRNKDVVEKGFKKLKSSLDMRRFRVHSSPAMANKEFICFLSLILYSHLDKLMSQNNLYRRLTIHRLLNKFKATKLYIIGDNLILDPFTKFQKDVLNLFDIRTPLRT
jgi:transposase